MTSTKAALARTHAVSPVFIRVLSAPARVAGRARSQSFGATTMGRPLLSTMDAGGYRQARDVLRACDVPPARVKPRLRGGQVGVPTLASAPLRARQSVVESAPSSGPRQRRGRLS